MHILIAGGCGYIGSILTPKLIALGHRVTVVDTLWFGNYLKPHSRLRVIEADIRDAEAVPMEGVDALIHLANIANDPCGDLDSKMVWEVNALATMGLAERAITCGVGQLIYASSGSVYGIKSDPRVTEDLPLVPISDYNKTKMISERILLSYKDRLRITCIRPATVCGYSPRMRLDVSVNMLTMQALTRNRITVFGGNQTRPNIHIQDLTDVFVHALNAPDMMTGIFNAGFENLSIIDIAQRVATRIPAEIVVTESNDPRSYRLDATRLLHTGFRPGYGVDAAIEEIIAAHGNGTLCDDDDHYNIRIMKKMIEASDNATVDN